MAPIRSRITIRRVASFAGLAAVLSLVALGLSQCRIVDDRLTGIRVQSLRGSSASCIAQCQSAANQAVRSESQLHTTNVKACNRDPACLAAEEARHEAALASIGAARRACMDGCHQQGRGQGGD